MQKLAKIQHYWQDPMFEDGMFTYPNLYKRMVDLFSNGSHFVEIGSWKGQSASFMAVEIHNSEKNIKFDCVDHWGDLPGTPNSEEYYVKNGILYEKFLSNTERVKHIINPVRLDSMTAVKNYEDRSLDFVFIDGDHNYDPVVADIKAWLPKIKQLGVLAGHDYGWCEGVRRAVHDTLGDGVGKYEDRYGVGFSSYDDNHKEGCWVCQVEILGE